MDWWFLRRQEILGVSHSMSSELVPKNSRNAVDAYQFGFAISVFERTLMISQMTIKIFDLQESL